MSVERDFVAAGQQAFAALSGDWNPIHVDPVRARRLVAGTLVVHGVHALLWALDAALARKRGGLRLRTLQATFRQPIRVGDRVACEIEGRADGDLRLSLFSEGRHVLDAAVVMDAAPPQAPISWPRPVRAEPRDRPREEVSTAEGRIELAYDPEAMARSFPRLTRCLSEAQLAALLGVSRLVGMECPGLHSLMTSLEMAWEGMAGPPTSLDYRVERWDPRLQAVTILVEGAGLQGRVGALLRPAPVDQPAAAELARRVTPGEFADLRGLVVGGSRGLGEATAKLLGVGGADVRLTYRTGDADAARVCDEIRAAGGKAEAAAFDVLEEGASFAALQGWAPTHLFYFPTSYISLNETTAFSSRLFRAYGAYYVEGLVRCVEAALKLRPVQLTVFYPSTVALDEVLPKAIEYASAKAAGEAACAHLQKLHPQLRFRVSRLPRVLSDTTASILGAPALDAAEVMLGELRALRGEAPSRAEGSGARR